jgi:hypothetical protein
MAKIGDTVKMSEALKAKLIASGSAAHVEEFGDCVGMIDQYTQYGKGPTARVGPEVDVRWYPSGARYSYPPADLDVLDTGGMRVSRVVIGKTDACDSCGVAGRGRFAAAFGEGRTIICWLCLKVAGHVVPKDGVLDV